VICGSNRYRNRKTGDNTGICGSNRYRRQVDRRKDRDLWLQQIQETDGQEIMSGFVAPTDTEDR
jgi:hypothetical protein